MSRCIGLDLSDNEGTAKKVESQNVFANYSKFTFPNLVHFVWLYGRSHEMSFIQFLSALLVAKIDKPCVILFWYEGFVPTGA